LTLKGQKGQKVRKMMMVGAFLVPDLILKVRKGQKVRRFSLKSLGQRGPSNGNA
jgi:hypothetical protein